MMDVPEQELINQKGGQVRERERFNKKKLFVKNGIDNGRLYFLHLVKLIVTELRRLS